MPIPKHIKLPGTNVAELPAANSFQKGWPWTEFFDPSEEFKVSDGKYWPKISVIIPSYNRVRFFEESLRSVILQGYPNLEIIIMDGGSTDGSVELIKQYEPWITSWVSAPDDGQTDAVNKGWAKATGEILGWLATDDIYLPGTLWRVAGEYIETEFVALAGGTDIIDVNGVVIGRKGGKSFEPESILVGTKPGSPASFYRHDILDLVGEIRSDLRFNPDREFAIRIGEKYWPEMARTVDTPFSAFRAWSESITGSGGRAAVEERIMVVDEYMARHKERANASEIRKQSLHRIYTSQAKQERAVGSFWAELEYRIAALRQKPTLSDFVKILIRTTEIALRAPLTAMRR